jgi:hypothetical protein
LTCDLEGLAAGARQIEKRKRLLAAELDH